MNDIALAALIIANRAGLAQATLTRLLKAYNRERHAIFVKDVITILRRDHAFDTDEALAVVNAAENLR